MESKKQENIYHAITFMNLRNKTQDNGDLSDKYPNSNCEKADTTNRQTITVSREINFAIKIFAFEVLDVKI